MNAFYTFLDLVSSLLKLGDGLSKIFDPSEYPLRLFRVIKSILVFQCHSYWKRISSHK